MVNQGGVVLKTLLLGQSRFTLFSELACVWLLLVGLLLFNDFKREYQGAFSQLEFKTKASADQFERHWPKLHTDQRISKNQYLQKFSQGFVPELYFSVINSKGEVEASSLKNLTQLSYGPVLKQINQALKLGNNCLPSLSGLQMETVNACVFYYPKLKVYFIVSLHQQKFLQYWFEHSGFFLLALILGLFIFFILFYFLSLQQKNIFSKFISS